MAVRRRPFFSPSFTAINRAIEYSPGMTDFYQPPSSDVEQPIVRDEPGSPKKALLFGLTSYFGGGILLGIVIMVLHTILLMILGHHIDEAQQFWSTNDIYSPASLILHTIDFVMLFIGAYICAHVVNHRIYFYIFVYFVLAVVLSILLEMVFPDSMDYSTVQRIALVLIDAAICLFAGWLYLYNQLAKSR